MIENLSEKFVVVSGVEQELKSLKDQYKTAWMTLEGRLGRLQNSQVDVHGMCIDHRTKIIEMEVNMDDLMKDVEEEDDDDDVPVASYSPKNQRNVQ